MAVPSLALIVAIGAGLHWLLSDDDKTEQKPADVVAPPTKPSSALAELNMSAAPAFVPRATPSATSKRVTREDLAEALAYGERSFTKKEAVAALESLGFRKTAAYKALSPDGKFVDLMEITTGGLIEWKG